MTTVKGQDRLYSKNILTKKFNLTFKELKGDISKKLLNKISKEYEGKCILEGYIKKKSCNIISYSSGIITEGNKVSFSIVFECDVCLPMEGSKIDCIVKNVTKAGIRAEIDDDISPLVIFLVRDHHYQNSGFANINTDDIITVKIVGKRYELNDQYISVISELDNSSEIRKSRLQIEE